jgi:ethanolamine utilization protein EutJ
MISDSASQRIATFEEALMLKHEPRLDGTLFAGVDLGTANIVTAVVDDQGNPVAGVLTRSQSSVRDGLILDYVGAISILRKQLSRLQSAGYVIQAAAGAYPPGTTGRNCQAFANVLAAAGLKVAGLIDEPSAASLALEISEGCVVDIGGGTTGISVIENGEAIYTADEATGGIHIDLVLAGHYRVPVEEAERIKTDTKRHDEVFALIRPVFQKMASIVRAHLQRCPADTLYLVGGTSCFPGIADVMQEETGLNVLLPVNPLLVTPLGIALSCLKKALSQQ